MYTFMHGATGALQIAGNFSGVPYAGTVATLIAGIVEVTNQVQVHKRKCQRLAAKANLLLSTIQDQSHRLEGTDLQEAMDQVTNILEHVHNRTRKYSRYNRVKCFLKLAEIEKGLDQCESELDNSMNIFNVNANIIIQQTQVETQAMIQANRAATEDILLQILTNQEDMRRIVQYQDAGQHVAERVMEAGQLRMRQIRERNAGQEHLQELIIADRRTSSSPPPQLAHTPQPQPPPVPVPQEGERYLQYQRGLFELHRAAGIPPTVKSLNGEVTKMGDLAVTGGTYSDVWIGMWLDAEKVALKALRNIKASDKKAQKRFEHEIVVWDRLRHDNILSFYGIVTDLGQIHMVSPWQEHGNVLEYVGKNPDANRIHLLFGAAKGIEYLHSRNIVHGNLKCANILVASDGEARICDFGMSTVIEEVTEKSASATLTAAGSARWLAPELIEGSIASPTFPADTYSFAMAILELLTGKHPFANLKRDASVIHNIVVLKLMPKRPEGPDVKKWLSDDLWELMRKCWSPDAPARPPMSVVADGMKSIEASLPATGSDAMDTS
jgi:hypothetical protein